MTQPLSQLNTFVPMYTKLILCEAELNDKNTTKNKMHSNNLKCVTLITQFK